MKWNICSSHLFFLITSEILSLSLRLCSFTRMSLDFFFLYSSGFVVLPYYDDCPSTILGNSQPIFLKIPLQRCFVFASNRDCNVGIIGLGPLYDNFSVSRFSDHSVWYKFNIQSAKRRLWLQILRGDISHTALSPGQEKKHLVDSLFRWGIFFYSSLFWGVALQ